MPADFDLELRPLAEHFTNHIECVLELRQNDGLGCSELHVLEPDQPGVEKFSLADLDFRLRAPTRIDAGSGRSIRTLVETVADAIGIGVNRATLGVHRTTGQRVRTVIECVTHAIAVSVGRTTILVNRASLGCRSASAARTAATHNSPTVHAVSRSPRRRIEATNPGPLVIPTE